MDFFIYKFSGSYDLTISKFRRIAKPPKVSSHKMQPLFILIAIILTACSSKLPSNEAKVEELNGVADTWSVNDLHVDSTSVETQTFRDFWLKAEKSGYTFKDDTIVPFVKVIFQLKTEKFYSDTLVVKDRKVLDGVNIHRMEIKSRKPIQGNYYPNIIAEEWKFEGIEAAAMYAKAWAEYIDKGYGVKSPTLIAHKDSTVYMFGTAAYMFIPEMERMVKLLNPGVNVLGKNY
jgi:hypothetical protein